MLPLFWYVTLLGINGRKPVPNVLAGYALLEDNALGEWAAILHFHRRIPQ